MKYGVLDECGIDKNGSCKDICGRIAEWINGFDGLTADVGYVNAANDEYCVNITHKGFLLAFGWGYFVDSEKNSVRKGIFYNLGVRKYGGDEWSDVEVDKLVFVRTQTKYGCVLELYGENKEKKCCMIKGEGEGKTGCYVVIDDNNAESGNDDGLTGNIEIKIEGCADEGIVGTAQEEE